MNDQPAYPQDRIFRGRARQDAVLAFVAGFIREHHGSPTYRQIAAATGVSLSAVGRHIDGLLKRGELVVARGKHRALSLPNPSTHIHLDLQPEVAGELVLFATAHGISVETAAAEAIRAYVGAAA